MMEKIKAILPSLREKKRYLVYEIVSNKKFEPNAAEESIKKSYFSAFGNIDTAKAGLIFLNNRFDKEKQKGVIKVNHKRVDNLRYALSLIKKIKNSKVIIRSVGCSGILNKTKQYLAKGG